MKAVDPTAEILGPVAYGIGELVSLQDAPDWPEVRGGAAWFLDWYLDRMRDAEATAGRRLLDVVDFHYYPEARGDHRITDPAADTPADIAARLQAPRMLWDAGYREPNSRVSQYLGEYLPVLPRVRRSIAEHYPGTKLAITEYDFGGRRTISGGIAQADVLGIFGRHGVDIATAWGLAATDIYALAAFRLFRDYDGAGGAFGNTSVKATTSDAARVSAYASIEDDDPSVLHVIVLNRDVAETLAVRVAIAGGAAYASGAAWSFGPGRALVSARGALQKVTPAGVEVEAPPLTALHLVLRAAP